VITVRLKPDSTYMKSAVGNRLYTAAAAHATGRGPLDLDQGQRLKFKGQSWPVGGAC